MSNIFKPQNNLKKKEVEENNKKLLIENFPKLTIIDNNISFLNKVKTKNEKKKTIEKDLDFKNLKSGWILLKKDEKTGKIIKKSKEIENIQDLNYKTENENINIINSLVNLYEKRTEDYIESWGEDEWEYMFKFSNYDYDYFNKIDDKDDDDDDILLL